MVGALLLGFVCGVIARMLMPRDAFRGMSGPTSWAVSLGLGLAGALLGYVIFTLGLGIGDTDIFDWGGLLSAIIGTLIVIAIAGYFLRRRQSTSPPPPSGDGGSRPPG
ncbi:putative secreted protein with PEP-CTERM sorting signal [Kribbella amoyensis]|uniref:Putative secreted protein with PEP-CTERM sorting signal n=1 Tax=Kribbella amoyensis TaxID=996641 RepID=A0A561B323_9ACTN|nr:GlsB/YeaQ/YmgE family stress response membrane protein [Kribbella amoyensis]TWD73263.1 putative secreted protein with PEP-CTERM sorting signal [Kribbella amoyensis]